MENTAVNGTTNATKDHEDWKKKKGYGPILVAVSLVLLLSSYAGGYLGSGTNLPSSLHREEKVMTNAAVSSSSTSLVGLSTTASNLKTLTIELDDDENIDGLLSGWLPKGSGGGQPPGTNCKKTSDCAIPSGLDHAVCREGYCRSGASGSSCGATSDCVVPPGMEHAVCRDGQCQSGDPGSSCGDTSDCGAPPGLDHGVCHDGTCKSGEPGSYCGVTSDCVVPTGLEHAVCRDGRCQSGHSGDRCEKDSECVVPSNLDHGVCRGPTKRCQR